ncbi:hypothetical protein DFH09DRAFT_1358884 [Mycena vulgaris]|nr:hypothetical protein DFH09DRAFT_1358884 [Mycena vulgaris]
MSLPPVPPRPYSATPTPHLTFESPPHFDNPLAAPRPHRVDPSLGANSTMVWFMRDCPLLLWGWCWDRDDTDSTLQMARDLDNSSASAFIQPRPPSALPPPQGADWSPWAPAVAAAAARTPSPMPPRLPSPPRDGSLTVPLPSTAALTAALPTVTAPSHDPQLQLAWARDVLFLVDRTPSLSTSPLALAAAPLVLSLASAAVPEALHLRATFAASGAYPNLLPANPRAAFRDFEATARTGYAPAWFRLARDYEAFNDSAHALDCLTRGARATEPAALHRVGAAHLLSQLGLSVSPAEALPYLHLAADFSVRVAPGLLAPYLPGGRTRGSILSLGAAGFLFPPEASSFPRRRHLRLSGVQAIYALVVRYLRAHSFLFIHPSPRTMRDAIGKIFHSLGTRAQPCLKRLKDNPNTKIAAFQDLKPPIPMLKRDPLPAGFLWTLHKTTSTHYQSQYQYDNRRVPFQRRYKTRSVGAKMSSLGLRTGPPQVTQSQQ